MDENTRKILMAIVWIIVGVLVGRKLFRREVKLAADDANYEYNPVGATTCGLLFWPIIIVIYAFYLAFTWRNE